MATNAYETVEGFKGWVRLGDSVDDITIDAALEGASRGIDNFCHTRFWKTAAGTARFFDTCYPRYLRISDAVAVTEVATDKNADGTYETVWASTDFQLLPLNPADAPELLPYSEILAVDSQTFPNATSTKRIGLVRVTGTWGWPAIPAPVIQATRLITNRLIKRRGSPEGIAGFDEFGTVRISARDDPDAVRYLEPYKTNRRAGGWAMA